MILLFLKIFSTLSLFALNVRENFSFPRRLSKKEESELIERMDCGDEQAKKKLIEHNLRLVSHVAKKFYSKTGEPDELISIGTIGLVKGVNSFKKSKNTKLSTYLAKCIQNEILMFLRVQKKSEQDISINDPIEKESESSPLTLGDILSDETVIDDLVDVKINSEKLHKFIDEIKDEREKAVIIKRYGLDGKKEMTQMEIAKQLGISRSYVSRIEKKVIEELRGKFNPR